MRPLLARVSIAVCLPLATSAVLGNELAGHVKDYLDAKPKVRGSPEERSKKAREQVAPILGRIGKLGTDESLAFLQKEMDTAIPEIAACCPGAILASENPAALGLLIRGFSRRDPQVKNAILDALGKSERDLAPAEDDILALAKAADFDARLRLPAVLARLDTVPSARALLGLCQATKSPKGEDRTEGVFASVLEALGKMKSEAVKAWMAGGAFDDAGSDQLRLTLVCRLSGNLKLEPARERLQKLVSHSSKRVAGASLDAIQKMGVGGSAAEIAAAIEKRKGKEDYAFRMQAMDALAALGTPEALEKVLGYAKGSDPELRAIAIGSLRKFEGKTRAMEGLLGALGDPDDAIRANALWGLAEFRDKAMVGPLIHLLEKDERLRVQALEMLVKLTGQNMDLVAEDWKKWWEVAEPTFQLPDAKSKGTTRVKAREFSYFGLEVSSKKIAFLVDASKSMDEQVPVKLVKGKEGEARGAGTSVGGKQGGDGGGDIRIKDGKAMKIALLKRELGKVIEKLPGETQVNIVPFHREFTPWQQQLQPLAGPGRARALDFVKGIETRSGTNVFDTLEFALADKRVDTIYLLSDGLPSAGKYLDIPSITREVQALNRRRGITIHCIAFGEESKLLEAIAKENGGQYRFVDKVEE